MSKLWGLGDQTYRQTDIYLSVSTHTPVSHPKYTVSCDKSHPSLKYNWSFESYLQISFSYFCIGSHMCHRRIYHMWLILLYTVVRHFIYLLWSVCTIFRKFRVPVNFLFQSVWFQKICNELILWYISEDRIWFPTVIFNMLIITVEWIGGWFIIVLILSLLLKSFSFGCDTPQWMHLDWKNFALSTVPTELSKSK